MNRENLKQAVMVKLASTQMPQLQSYEKPETSYMRDFLAGVDPTGNMTFAGALSNRQNHGMHKAMNIAGGTVAGATLIPSTILGGIAGVSNIKKGLRPALSAAWEGFKKPMSDVYTAYNLRNLARKANKTGTMDAIDPEKANRYIQFLKENVSGQGVQDAFNSIPPPQLTPKLTEGSLGQRAANTAQRGKEVAEKAYNVGLSAKDAYDLQKAFRSGQSLELTPRHLEMIKGVENATTEGLKEGVGMLGAGAGINAGSAYLQYGSAQDLQREYDKARGVQR